MRIVLRNEDIRMKKYYEKKLKLKAFYAIKENYIEAFTEKNHYSKAEHFNSLWIKKLFFSVIVDKLEQKRDKDDEIKLMHLNYKARKIFDKNLQLKCIREWKIFIIDQRKEKVI